MAEPIYLEDLAVGDVFLSDHYTLDAEQIIRFATEFDPQPFHLDHHAARDTFSRDLPRVVGRRPASQCACW